MKKLVIVILLCMTAAAAFGQARPTLAILPFTGGGGEDGETLAELFSFDQTLNGAFTPVPRTSINAAIQKEQNFQMSSGMTDPETISRIGKQLGARYIVAGSITRLGSQQLVVIAIMQIENLQQIAGEWLTYQNISEVRGKLPEMAKNIVAASQKNTSRLQKLAVLPFQTPSGDRESDALAQILAAEIIRTGAYAVFPRTKTLEQVQGEYNTQLSGITDDYSIAAIGRGDNPLLALSGAARRLGQDRMFNAAIINVESGAQVKGDYVEYQVIEEGLQTIQILAGLLTGVMNVPASNLQELLKAVEAINKAGAGNYTINLTGDITIGPNDKDIRFTSNAKKTITIQGSGKKCSLTSRREKEELLKVPSGITLVLGRNLRLSSTSTGVRVEKDGTLRMENGANVDGCRGNSAIFVNRDGTFIMNGGTISDNRLWGINVFYGTFSMNGGTISGNLDTGVVVSAGTFSMNGGTISGNYDTGVVVSAGTFSMNGGTISDNAGDGWGGGVFVAENGTFSMNGGTISYNTVTKSLVGKKDSYGGGVYVKKDGKFVKTGGSIEENKAENGGNAVYVEDGKKRNRDAGPSDNMDSSVKGKAGGWE